MTVLEKMALPQPMSFWNALYQLGLVLGFPPGLTADVSLERMKQTGRLVPVGDLWELRHD